MRIVVLLATLAAFAVGFWAKMQYSEGAAQISSDTNQAIQGDPPQAASVSDGFSPSKLVDSVMGWFGSTDDDGRTVNPYSGDDSRPVDVGHFESNSFVD